jgi:serine/threonine protein kinase
LNPPARVESPVGEAPLMRRLLENQGMTAGLGPGSSFGPYRLESILGRGGMSVVYLAEDTRLGRRVAIKLLSSELAEDESFRSRFVRESQLAAGLEHPNITRLRGGRRRPAVHRDAVRPRYRPSNAHRS